MTSYLLTANQSLWTRDSQDYVWILEQATRTANGERPGRSRWSTARKYGYEPGDTVYMLVQGPGQRGLIASGRIETGEVYEDESWRHERASATYIDVEWDAFVAPPETLPTEKLKLLAPATGWRPQGSGTKVAESDEAALKSAWEAHLVALEYLAPQNSGNLTDADDFEIHRSYAVALRKVRRHQRQFRELLIKHYPHECAYCGLDVMDVLEAAHIEPDAEGGAASIQNGRLLCANHHRAFDAGLLRWDETRSRFVRNRRAPVVPPGPLKNTREP